jgi:hypothetical protein
VTVGLNKVDKSDDGPSLNIEFLDDNKFKSNYDLFVIKAKQTICLVLIISIGMLGCTHKNTHTTQTLPDYNFSIPSNRIR